MSGPARMPVAIIGMAGVMPGSEDLAGFWRGLLDARDMVTEVPATRWDWRRYAGPVDERRNVISTSRGGFIPRADGFDPDLFGISPREAECLDPQQRLLLCAAWEAFECAALSPAALAGRRCGVFIGASGNDFKSNLEQPGRRRALHQAPGTHQTMLANRLSYQFDLSGPSETIDTACSGSLVAIHRALTLLHTGEIDMALAGGIHLMLNPEMSVQYSRAGMLSPDGRCHTFDHRANGYVRSEGLGLVVLKPLAQAIADDDPIHGVLVGSAENHGGRATSLTAPNPRAQTALIVESMRGAGLKPEHVGLVEAHGTGTALGDPIEVNALKAAFEQLGFDPQAAPWCALGAVKTAVGHLEAAAGMAGLFKALFSIGGQIIPANLHHEKTNPHVVLKDSPLRLADGHVAWPAQQPQARHATISSFGFGGVNAHLIAAPAPAREAPDHARDDTRQRLFVLSAPDRQRLARQAAALLALPLLAPHAPAEDGRAGIPRLRAALATHTGRSWPESDDRTLFADLGVSPDALFSVLTGELGHPPALADSALRRGASMATLSRLLAASGRQDAEDSLLIRRLPSFGPDPRLDLDALAWTLATGRHCFDERAAIIAGDASELARALAALAGRGAASERLWQNNPRSAQLTLPAADETPGVARCIEDARLWLNKRRPRIDWSAHFERRPARCSIPGTALDLRVFPLGDSDGHLRHPAAAAEQGHSLLGANQSGIDGLGFVRPIQHDDPDWSEVAPGGALARGLRILEASATAALQLGRREHVTLRDMVWAAPASLLPGEQLATRVASSEGRWFAEALRRAADGDETLLAQSELDFEPDDGPPALDGDWQSIADDGAAGWAVRVADAIRRLLPAAASHAPVRLGTARIERAFSSATAPVRARISKRNGDLSTLDLVVGGACLQGLELRALGAPCAAAEEAMARLAVPGWRPLPASRPRTPADRTIVLEHDEGAFWQARLSTHLAGTHPLAADFDLSSSQAWADRLGRALADQRAGRVVLLVPAADTLLTRERGAPLALQLMLLALGQCGLTRLGLRRLTLILVQSRPLAAAAPGPLEYLAAWGKSLGFEDDVLALRVVRAPQLDPESPASLALLAAECGCDDTALSRWHDGQRGAPTLRPLAASRGTDRLGSSRGGSVLISGGLGALSLALAVHLARRHGLQVWLCGRRAADEARIAAWREQGLAIEYRSLDMSDLAALRALVAEIDASDTPIKGVVHCAGVARDRLAARKTRQDLIDVTRSKIDCALALDEATATCQLRFFALFGSVVGRFGNPGQADYASANAWLADFAGLRAESVAAGRRHGHSVCIDWPYWIDGGMRLDASQRAAFETLHGLTPLPTERGLTLFDEALRAEQPHLVVLHGQPKAIARHLDHEPMASSARTTQDEEYT